jgi:hypothetical protein
VKLTTHLYLVPRSQNAWSYTSTPQYAFMAVLLIKIKAQGQLYLYLYFTFINKSFGQELIASGRVQWRTLVNILMNFKFHKRQEIV